MKITLLEPLGIPEEVLARYQSRLEKRGHQFTAYGEKTTDPAELIRRTGESEIVILANNPYPAEVVEAAPNLKMLDVAFTGIDHVALQAKGRNALQCRWIFNAVCGGACHWLDHRLPAEHAGL